MNYEDAINVYADGSSYPNPRKGGFAVRIIVFDDNGNDLALQS
jgi:ribonuclease HI